MESVLQSNEVCFTFVFFSSPSVSQSRLTYRINSQTVDHVEHYKRSWYCPDTQSLLGKPLQVYSFKWIENAWPSPMNFLKRGLCSSQKGSLSLTSKVKAYLLFPDCLESIQRRATKYILSDYSSDYKI